MGCNQSMAALPEGAHGAGPRRQQLSAESAKALLKLPSFDVTGTRILRDAAPDVRAAYRLGDELGRGNLGTVREAVHLRSGRAMACKSISKARLMNEPAHREAVVIEAFVLQRLAGHRGTVLLEGLYEDDAEVHLIMEKCTGGELFDSVIRGGRCSEAVVADVIRDVLDIVAHCHRMGVIHGDLKLENLMLTGAGAEARVKVIDFGSSSLHNPGDVHSAICGTSFYVAPEVLAGSYTPLADVWSIGVMMYTLLCGSYPFDGDSDQEVFEAVLHAPLSFPGPVWAGVGATAKDCIVWMLQRDPARRPSATKMLGHAFLRPSARPHLDRANSYHSLMTPSPSPSGARRQHQDGGFVVPPAPTPRAMPAY